MKAKKKAKSRAIREKYIYGNDSGKMFRTVIEKDNPPSEGSITSLKEYRKIYGR
jgi:hypothetical protein